MEKKLAETITNRDETIRQIQINFIEFQIH